MSIKKMNFTFGSLEFKMHVNRNEEKRRERKFRALKHELKINEVINHRSDRIEFGTCDMYR